MEGIGIVFLVFGIIGLAVCVQAKKWRDNNEQKS